MKNILCPKCSEEAIKNGCPSGVQRYLCKKCWYHFTMNQRGKRIDNFYVVRALQLRLEGLSTRSIERVLGVSHVTVLRWLKKHGQNLPQLPTKKVEVRNMAVDSLCTFLGDKQNVTGCGILLTTIEDTYSVVKWKNDLPVA